MTVLARTRSDLAAALAALPGPPVLVPTMGALHEGHEALLAAAGPGAVVSVFVNPLQFGQASDLQRYPRTPAADVETAARAGAAVVFAPEVGEVYPDGSPAVTVSAGPLGAVLEGRARPGHFDGVLTVVAKLFGLIRPRAAVFGEKDFQQLVLIRRMVADLELGVELVSVPIVRDADGLALSSRNRHLSGTQRRQALALSRALGQPDLAAARRMLSAADGVELDYCELVDPSTLRPAPSGPGRLLVAARVGGVRLIDNAALAATDPPSTAPPPLTAQSRTAPTRTAQSRTAQSRTAPTRTARART